MKITIEGWVLFAVIAGAAIAAAVALTIWGKETGWTNKRHLSNMAIAAIWVAVTVLIFGTLMLENWYYTSTASGIRAVKEQVSNLNNGIYREVEITTEDGRQIYYFCGKIDLQTVDDGAYILFEDQDGLRHIIYPGKLDTVRIEELPEPPDEGEDG